MLFVVIAKDKENSLALRIATREAHFAYALAGGVIKLGGPFLDANGDMCGSLIIFEAENLEAAKAWHAGDPYVKAGLFVTSEVQPWKSTFNPVDIKF